MTAKKKDIKQFFQDKYGINLDEADIEMLNDSVLISHHSRIQEIQNGLCRDQSARVLKAVTQAMNDYYHKGMTKQEIIQIVSNVVNNKAGIETVDTVRFLIVD